LSSHFISEKSVDDAESRVLQWLQYCCTCYILDLEVEMTPQQWVTARREAKMTQVQAASTLDISQPYLSQLEKGKRVAPPDLIQKAMAMYKVSPTALPLPKPEQATAVEPDYLEKELAALGYPGFAHVRSEERRNPAEVVYSAVLQSDLDTRLVEALPWVMTQFPDLNWCWLRDNTKLRNAQNRLGYLVHLAIEVAKKAKNGPDVETLSSWERDLEEARLARESTLCRESMPQREREWLRSHRPAAAEHWNLLTSLTSEQLRYAA
jgi:transcriptional regulator with XRE-family HTH domain